MTILDALLERRDPLRERDTESRAIRDNDLWGAWAAGEDTPGGIDPSTGVRVSRDGTLAVAAAWACMSLIGDSIATLPVDAVVDLPSGQTKSYGQRPPWLDAPNREQTKIDFIFNQVVSMLADGAAFVYTPRDRRGDIVEAWTLNPDWCRVFRERQPDGSLALVYYVMVSAGQQSPVGPFRLVAGTEMFHINAFQASSGWPRGISPIEAQRQLFGSAIAGQEMGARFFGHGMNAAGVIEATDDMTIEQARELKADFGKANGGFRKMHLPPVLTGGATFKPIQISPEQAQFIEQRRFSVEEIARVFRVPPYLIGDMSKTSSWGTGIEQMNMGFVTYTLRPWIERLEAAWTRHMLLFEKGARIQFDVAGLLRGDHAARAQYYKFMFNTGAMSPNQIATAEGLEPFDLGDQHYYPVTTAPIGTQPATVLKQIITEDGVTVEDEQPAQGGDDGAT